MNFPHIAPVQFDEENPLDLTHDIHTYKRYLEELVDHTFDCMIIGRPVTTTAITLGIINSVIRKEFSDLVCPAGVGTLSIAEDLIIQPCFMYTADDTKSLGKIGDSPDKLVNEIIRFSKNKNNKNKYLKCERCFARSICSSCLGTFDIEERTKEFDVTCTTITTILRRVLYRFSVVQQNPEQWEKLSQQLNLF